MIQRYEVYIDPYHNILRLNLFSFDGSPMNPMYLAYRPPEMLPTSTLNPMTTATAAPTGSRKLKRSLSEDVALPLNHKVLSKRDENTNTTWMYGLSLGLTVVGAYLYLCF